MVSKKKVIAAGAILAAAAAAYGGGVWRNYNEYKEARRLHDELSERNTLRTVSMDTEFAGQQGALEWYSEQSNRNPKSSHLRRLVRAHESILDALSRAHARERERMADDEAAAGKLVEQARKNLARSWSRQPSRIVGRVSPEFREFLQERGLKHLLPPREPTPRPQTEFMERRVGFRRKSRR